MPLRIGYARWLRAAFADTRWDIHDVATDDDIVVIRSTASSRHTGAVRPLRRVRGRGAGHAADRPGLLHHSDPLVPRRRRQGDRALGEPRRYGHGAAARLGTAKPALPDPHGAGHAPRLRTR